MRVYLLSFFLFHTEDLSKCDTRMQESDEKRSSQERKWVQSLPSADAGHTASLPFPVVWLAANLALEGCIYTSLTRHGLRGVFSGLSHSLGKCPNMTHCHVVFLILQLAWKTGSRKQCTCLTLNFTDNNQVMLILASYRCLLFLLWQSFLMETGKNLNLLALIWNCI